MPLQIDDRGGGNEVLVDRATHAALTGRIAFTGTGARVVIGHSCVDAGLFMEVGSAATVLIGARNHLGGLFIHAGPGARVRIGDDCGLNGLVRFLLHEPASITVGDGCLLAAEVDLSVSDMHPIFDAATGARVNPAKDIVLADRVWIGQRALLLKGATVGADSVVGAASVLSGRVPPGCVAAGNPARVIRRGITWRMDL